MILNHSNLCGSSYELAHLEPSMQAIGFIRWQWEYTRATYDWKIVGQQQVMYYLRVHTRAQQGKFEQPDAIILIESITLGTATYPHGIDYDASLPETIIKLAEQQLNQLAKILIE